MSNLDERKILRRPRILLGVTGSVAAVKAPEIAVRLVNEFHAQVRVLLSAGGSNFWEKAKEYDEEHWDLFQQIMNASQTTDGSFQIQLICTYHFPTNWCHLYALCTSDVIVIVIN